MKFIYFFIFNFLFTGSIFASKNHGISQEIAKQSGCKQCEKRVTDWFDNNPDKCLYRNTQSWEKNGVIAFHKIPLAATKFLKRFKYYYKCLSEKNNNIYNVDGTPGVIRFFDANNMVVYKPVMFEVGTCDQTTVAHRTATTHIQLEEAQPVIDEIRNNLQTYIEAMESQLSKKNQSTHSDGSYVCTERKDGSAVIASSKDQSVATLLFLKRP